MQTNTVVYLILILSVSQASSDITTECITCLEHSKIFIKTLYPHSPFPYQCVNDSKDIFLGAIVVARACNKWDCLLLNRDNKRVYNKTILCKESDPCVREPHSGGGRLFFAPFLLVSFLLL